MSTPGVHTLPQYNFLDFLEPMCTLWVHYREDRIRCEQVLVVGDLRRCQICQSFAS